MDIALQILYSPNRTSGRPTQKMSVKKDKLLYRNFFKATKVDTKPSPLPVMITRADTPYRLQPGSA